MTRDEAWKFLELEDGSNPEAVEAVFARRTADLARRIAGAATPTLRTLYEQQAERLREAREVLLRNGRSRSTPPTLSMTQQRDLPALTPSTTGPVRPVRSIEGQPLFASPREGDVRPPDNSLSLTQRHDLPVLTPLRSFVGGDQAPDPESLGTAIGINIGQVLGDRYEIRAHLGTGGMGAVFAAFDRFREEEVALKILLPHLLADPQARERFLNEARIASSLSHAGIVRVYDVQQGDGLTFLTMERLQGRSLRDEIARRAATAQRFSVAEVRDIAEPLCDALAYAHKLTVHRDVKPENIWLGEDGTVKLMDFGIARLLRPSQFTSTGLALGTAYYMAPEQLRGQEVDHRADQFAMGVILYELLTGEIPQGVIQSPHRVRRSVPAGLSEAVMKSLAGDPQKRHADMSALRRALSARSGAGMGRRVVAAVAISLLLGAGASYQSWLPPLLRTFAKGQEEGIPRATVVHELTAEEKAAESTYREQAGRIDELKNEAETIGARIESAGKQAPGEVAEQVADLWRRHPRRGDWLSQAEAMRARALAMEKEGAFVKAEADLKAAVADYGKPRRWWDHANQALGSIERTRATLVERLGRFPASTMRSLSAWPESLTTEVEDKLLEGDGAEGLAEADRVAGRLDEIDKLLSSRQSVVKAAQMGSASEQVDGLRARYAAAGERLQEADGALMRDRLADSRRLYATAASQYQAILDELNGHIDGLIASATGSLKAGKFDAALVKARAALKLRPGEDAEELVRRAEIGGPIARIRESERSGERDDALTALADLRKQKPDDPDVRKLMNEYLDKIVAEGRSLLRADRYDDALKEFQRIRKLRPGDKALVDQLAGEVESRRQSAIRLAAERDEARRKAIELQREREQRAWEQAEAARRIREAEQAAANRPFRTNTFGAAGEPAQGGGIFVIQSNPGTPAEGLGLEYSDVIYTVNGRQVNTVAEYFSAVHNSPDNMTLTFRDCRTGIVKQATVRLNR
jgi:hypothetical protein